VHYRLSHRRYVLPFRVPVRTAHGLWREREGVLLRLEDGEGRRRWGEAAPIPWFGTETAAEVAAACRDLGTRVDDAQLDAVPARLACLRGALAAARMDLVEPENPAARPVAALLPAGREALARIGPQAEIGFRVFKWKVGAGAAADELALLDEVCARLPNGGKLRLDANGAWDRRTAERWLERCAERPVEFVEQPCLAGPTASGDETRRAEELLRGLAADYPTPLALDESLIGAQDVARWLGAGWPGYFVVKPGLLADAAGTLATLEKARARVVFSSALETAIGAQSALRRAFGWRGTVFALGFGVGPLFADARCDGPGAAPFLHWADVNRMDGEAAWNALS
jgi:O-succinylbenzoate synthase